MAGQTDESLSDHVRLPRPPTVPPDSYDPRKIFSWIRAVLMSFMQNLLRALEHDIDKVHSVVKGMIDKGPNISPVGSTLTLTARIHCVTGSSDITTIQASPGFVGWAYLISIGGGWTLATGGNIAAAASPGDGECLLVVYDVFTGLWHPSGVGSGSPHVIPYTVRGYEALAGTKNSSNKDFTLPGGDQFYLDANGNVFGVLFLNANPLSPTDVAPVAGNFEYQRTSLTTIKLSEAPASTDSLAFYGLLVKS